MRSQLYPYARELFATAQLDWTSGTMRALLLPSSYVPDFEDQFLSDIFAGVRISTSNAIAGRTASNGVCSASPIKFPLLVDNRLVAQALIYKDTGVEGTSPLVFFIGDEDLVNEPFLPQGFSYYIYPNIVDGGFFRL